MQRFLILLCCLLASYLPAPAQQAGNSHVQEYTTDNGLPSNGIKGLQWDEKTNFLWLATEAGIVRFNGVDFNSYTRQNTPTIGSERMLFLLRNNTGKIYTSDQAGNIFRITQNKPMLWRASSNSPIVRNYYLLKTSDSFFLKYADRQDSRPFSASSDQLICLSDTSCLLLQSGALYYLGISTGNPVPLQVDAKDLTYMFKTGDNYFITTKRNELFLFDAKEQTLHPVAVADENGAALISLNYTNHLFWEMGMKNPVYVDGGNAWIFTYDGSKIVAKLAFTGIPSNAYIKSIQYSEKNKLLFIGTDSKGLIVVSQYRVETKKTVNKDPKNRNSYYSQIELSNGNVLTNEGDIIGSALTPAGTIPIKGKFDFYVTVTNDSLLWYNQAEPKLGHTCMHQYNKHTGATKIFPKIKWGNLVAESGSSIYMAENNGIGILEDDSLRYLYRYPKLQDGNTSFDFKEIAPGILAVATCNGLFRFDTHNNKLDTLFKKENICVRSIWKYKDYVFFGTYGAGFYIMKNDVIKQMPLDKNNYLLYTHCFILDDQGFCWLSTNRGLFKASLDDILNAYENNTARLYYHYFGKNDGMEMTELNGGCMPCALHMANDNISFPSMDGLLFVDPTKAVPVLPEGDLYIDEMQADNNKINTDSLAYQSLPAGTQEILIKLGFSSWCNKENIYLDYQLNDAPGWKPINTNVDAVIRLNNMSPGTYKLRIRKVNGFGINNYSYTEIRFKIRTPWNKQWWFYLLVLFALLGIVLLFSYLRTRQYRIRQYKLEKQVAEKTKELQEKNEVLEKNNSIKTRLISIISHDIVTPLKFVTVAGKNLIEKRDRMSVELQQETIIEMTNTSQELQLLSTNILNWIKYQNENRRLAKETFNVHELVNQVFGVLNSLANQKKLRLVNNVDKDLAIHQFFEPLKILIYNLITNAINFSEKGDITIAEQQENEKLIISVQDEGVGMTPDQIKNVMADQFIISSANIDNRKGNGLGYLIIKDLVKMMDASLQINSEKGKGTKVSVLMPVTPSAP